ncbi:TPA: protein rep, partial [Staphylococcus aureus]|nr:protein rep [Staphylococcus aureus]
KGYVRKLEITYNEKRDDYHPHFHVLIVVNKSYFTDVKAYLNQKEWLRLWREATGISEITQVDVRRVKEQNSNELYEMA